MTTFNQGHALLVGVGADLPTTEEDAKGLGDILVDGGRCAYPPTQVAVLTGANATLEKVLGALATLAARTDEDSTVVIFFSGHGYHVTTSLGRQYYIMPYGYDVGALSETAISGKEFAEKLNIVTAKKVLVLLDCCHAA